MAHTAANAHELVVAQAPVATLRAYHRNPRRGDIKLIAQSLRVNGQYKPLTVNRGTHTGRPNEVLCGNHTLQAARDLAWDTIAITYVDVDDDQAARIVAVDNRSSDRAEYDDRLLLELLADLPDLDGTGYDPGDLQDLEKALKDDAPLPDDGDTDPDDVPDPPPDPITRRGDVWILGDHRLVCGNAADTHVWDALLDDVKADMVWTDPSYGVSYVGKTKDALRIENDEEEGIEQLLRSVLGLALAHAKPGACWYVTSPPGPLGVTFGRVLDDLDVLHQTLVWVKDQFVLGRSDYHYRHEIVFYGWSPGAAHREPPDRTHDSVHEVPRPKRSEEHPTMKPVALIERHITNSTDRWAVVVDPFAGSGSTLLACHRTGRAAYLIELEPAYCDVICRRWQEHVGDMPVLKSTGQAHNFARNGTQTA